MSRILSQPILLGLLLASVLPTTGCDRVDRPPADQDAVKLSELASHLGVKKYRFDVPASITKPLLVLRTEEEGRVGSFSSLPLRDNREATLLFSTDADGRGKFTLFAADGTGLSHSRLTAFRSTGSSSVSTTRSSGPIASGDWIELHGGDMDSSELETDPPFAYRLYVVEEGQTPEAAGW